jgi:hypothetical protein
LRLTTLYALLKRFHSFVFYCIVWYLSTRMLATKRSRVHVHQDQEIVLLTIRSSETVLVERDRWEVHYHKRLLPGTRGIFMFLPHVLQNLLYHLWRIYSYMYKLTILRDLSHFCLSITRLLKKKVNRTASLALSKGVIMRAACFLCSVADVHDFSCSSMLFHAVPC